MKGSNNQLGTSLKLTIGSVLIFALFSYPLHSVPILVLLFICLALINNMSDAKVLKVTIIPVVRYIVLIPCILESLYIGHRYYIQGQYIAKWNSNKQDAIEGNPQSLKVFKELYPQMKTCGPFLINYGETLYSFNNFYQASIILNESKLFIINEEACYYLGEAYQKMRKYDQAQAEYKFIANMLPNRFKPKYLLANLYLSLGDSIKAKAMARTIIKMPVKVPSEEVDKMRYEMLNLLQE